MRTKIVRRRRYGVEVALSVRDNHGNQGRLKNDIL